MRMKMIPPPIDIGRLKDVNDEYLAGPRNARTTHKWTAVMILDTPH